MIERRVGRWEGTMLVGSLLMAAMLAAAAWQASPADAEVPIKSFDMEVTSTQAGGHPDLIVDMEMGNQDTEGKIPCECNQIRDITIQTPPGFVGIPTNIPSCTAVQLGTSECPSDSQIGIQVIDFFGLAAAFAPIYNMVPAPSQLALLGSPLGLDGSFATQTVVSARTESDYGLEFKAVGLPRFFKFTHIVQITWGVPSTEIHDPLRFPGDVPTAVLCDEGDLNPLPELIANEYPLIDCGINPFTGGFVGIPANSQATPFQSNPTSCVGPMVATMDTVGYDLSTDHAETTYPTPTGCDQLAFDPSLSAKPTTEDADSASGVDIELTVPQTLSPSTPSPSQIRTSTVTFPAGMSLNSNAADGKTSCSDSQARFGTRAEAQCPEFSKIGTLEIESASLPGVLPGAIYLGKPLPGNRYRVFLTADGFSAHIKLPGVAEPDPETGQLTVSFSDLPQTPFERFNMHFFGAERGAFATPTQCGTYAVESEFVPWATGVPSQTSTQFFLVDSGPGGSPCPPATRPFSPSLNAGVSDNTGGEFTDFVFDLTRKDGDQNLSGVSTSTPAGFSAVLAGIPYCPDSSLAALAASSYLGATELASPICQSSQVGTAGAAAGAGSRPAFLSGRVYLAGPYKGAPLSLAIVTPAVSGPYDLGNVLVRVAVHVDPTTVRVSATTDPLPAIIEGIPLRLRRVVVMLDRENFALNPTNCDPFSVDTVVSGDQGGVARMQVPFQVANCGSLNFGPSLRIRLKGGSKRRGHPGIHATLKAGSGEANIRRAQVTLPKGQLLDNAHIQTICTRVDFAARTCPKGSRIGWAEAETPLLDKPLKGPVYLRSSSNRLPDLVLDLKGQIDIELAGRVDSVRGRLRTEFRPVPDVPVSRFVLRLAGGRKGILINSESLCGSQKRAKVVMVGQNGRRAVDRSRLLTSCGKARKQRRALHRAKRSRARSRRSGRWARRWQRRQPAKGSNRSPCVDFAPSP